MGVGEKSRRAKGYSEQMDQARTEELEAESVLGTKQIEGGQAFECELTAKDVELRAGTKVRLIDMKRECIEVFLGARSIGIVVAAGSAVLREKTHITKSEGRALKARVIDDASFMGTFMVELM
ncbi:MAG: hypothetical protein RLZZ129_403 [Verrucomicrobiota bacterium]|jgi:hypothetical protein